MQIFPFFFFLVCYYENFAKIVKFIIIIQNVYKKKMIIRVDYLNRLMNYTRVKQSINQFQFLIFTQILFLYVTICDDNLLKIFIFYFYGNWKCA